MLVHDRKLNFAQPRRYLTGHIPHQDPLEYVLEGLEKAGLYVLDD